MKQQCHIASIYVSWMIVLGFLIFFLLKGAYVAALLLPVVALLFSGPTFVSFRPSPRTSAMAALTMSRRRASVERPPR